MIKRYYDFGLLILLTCLVGLLLSNYGNPYVFHPDEIFILKRPFKRILEYTQLDFSSTFSLYDFALVVWYGLFFIVGLVLDFWSNLADFRKALVLEDFRIIYWGRSLSVLFVLVGNLVLYNHFRERYHLRQIWVPVIIAFNLFLVPSMFWIKYDAMMYMAFTTLFVHIFKYVVDQEKQFRNLIYIGLFGALAIRIEVLLLFASFLVFDLYSYYRAGALFAFFSRRWLFSASVGAVMFCCVTLYPLVVLNKLFGGPEAGLLASKTYESVILSDLMGNLLNHPVLMENLFYYVKVIVLLGGPWLFYAALFLRKADRSVRHFFLVYIVLYIGLITCSGSSFVHYVLGVVPLIAILGFEEMLSRKSAYVILVLFAIYVLSALVPFLVLSVVRTDERILTNEFLLANTSPADTIAIETISMNGFHPLIEEYPSALRQKAKLAQQLSPAAGVGYLERSSRFMDTTNCRPIIDVFSYNYLSADQRQSNRFINVYDARDFASRGVKFLVLSGWRPEGMELISSGRMAAEFRPFRFTDPRCNLLYFNRPTIRVYKVNPRLK